MLFCMEFYPKNIFSFALKNSRIKEREVIFQTGIGIFSLLKSTQEKIGKYFSTRARHMMFTTSIMVEK